MNIALILTWSRIVAIPVFLLVYVLPFSWAHPLACIIFAAAAITDWFDGYLARTLSQTTELGAFLDPVADKLLVAVALVMVLDAQLFHYLALAAIIIIGREIAISALREWMSMVGKRAGVVVTYVAKIKTTIQMVALGMLIWYHPGSSFGWLTWLGPLLLYASAILTLWSMFIYLKTAWPHLTIAGKSQ